MSIFPYRLRFSKTGKVRFLSHHDLMRVMERALRRTDLPLRMTEGFHPHPIIAFPMALGVGIESEHEIMEFELSSWIAPRQIESLLQCQFPEGVVVVDIEAFTRKQRSFVDFVEYEVTLAQQLPDMDKRIEDLLAKKEVFIERVSDKRTRQIDVRKYLMALDFEGARIFVRIKVTDSGTAKPEETLRALGIEIDESVRIRKTHTELGIRG